MTGNVLRATYADLKTVKTRSTCQLILELPIEALTEVVALLGAPVPGNEVWVAVARLKDGATAAQEPEALPPPKKSTLAQQAGILCNDRAFQKWVWEQFGSIDGIGGATAENAAAFIRAECVVKSRADLDKNDKAGQRFHDIRADYRLWLGDVVPA